MASASGCVPCSCCACFPESIIAKLVVSFISVGSIFIIETQFICNSDGLTLTQQCEGLRDPLPALNTEHIHVHIQNNF